jgi:hypothetical protein
VLLETFTVTGCTAISGEEPISYLIGLLFEFHQEFLLQLMVPFGFKVNNGFKAAVVCVSGLIGGIPLRYHFLKLEPVVAPGSPVVSGLATIALKQLL